MTSGLPAALPTWCRCASGSASTGSPSAPSTSPSTSGASTIGWRRPRFPCPRAGGGTEAGEGTQKAPRSQDPAPQSGGCVDLRLWRVLSVGQQQLRLHACVLPLPDAHGLPCLPAGEGWFPLLRALWLRPGGGASSAGGGLPCDLPVPHTSCHALDPLQVDLAVLEVGIGGAYDCTNIIR